MTEKIPVSSWSHLLHYRGSGAMQNLNFSTVQSKDVATKLAVTYVLLLK